MECFGLFIFNYLGFSINYLDEPDQNYESR